MGFLEERFNDLDFLMGFPGTQVFQTYTTCVFLYKTKFLQVSSQSDNRRAP